MGNILIDELKNSLLAIMGLAGGVASKQLLLMKAVGLTTTGWGGLALAGGAISTVVMGVYKAIKGYKKEAKLKTEEVAQIEHFAKLLEQLNREIIDKEKELEEYRAVANTRDHQRALHYARLAVECANELDELYAGMDELNIANPVSIAEVPPVIENKYFICEEQDGICNEAGKIKSDKVWGDINDCCVEAPMESVLNRLDTLGTLQDNAFREIDSLKELIVSERSGGSLIRKIKNKSKRNKTKRNKTNRKLTKINKTKRNKTKIKKTKRKINKRKINN